MYAFVTPEQLELSERINLFIIKVQFGRSILKSHLRGMEMANEFSNAFCLSLPSTKICRREVSPQYCQTWSHD